MSKATLKTTHQQDAIMLFFNSKEVFDTKRFDTERKARNYAKKYKVELFSELPDGVDFDPYTMGD